MSIRRRLRQLEQKRADCRRAAGCPIAVWSEEHQAYCRPDGEPLTQEELDDGTPRVFVIGVDIAEITGDKIVPPPPPRR